MTQRRAVTLLELLIAIGLLVALAAIAAPSLMGQLSERRFDATVDAVTQQLLLARAEAQMTGRPVEVRAVTKRGDAVGQLGSPTDGGATPPAEVRHEQWRVEARLLQLELPDEVMAESEVRTRGGADDHVDPTIYEAWAQQPLPSGFAIVDERPSWLRELSHGASEDEQPANPTSGPSGAGRRNNDGADVPIRLAVFLPDGSSLIGDTAWLVEDEQRAAAISVDAWTGLPTVQRLKLTERLPNTDEAEQRDEQSLQSEQERELLDEDADDNTGPSGGPATDRAAPRSPGPAENNDSADGASGSHGSNAERDRSDADEEMP